MNFEQIMIRLGVDGTAVKSGLAQVSAYAKGWGVGLVHDLKGSLLKTIGAAYVADKLIEGLGEIKNKILEIHRAQEDLGGQVSTNFIQGLFNMSERLGLSYEGLSRPLLKFKQTLDAAKLDPQGIEAQNLIRYGIITKAADLDTQSFVKSIGKLSDAYVKTGHNLKVFQDMNIRLGGQFPAFIQMMNMGSAAIERMDKSNPFTKLTPQTIEQFSAFYSGVKNLSQISYSTIANGLASVLSHSPLTLIGRAIGQMAGDPHSSRNLTETVQRIKNIWSGIPDEQEKQNEKLALTYEMEQRNADVAERLLQLKERQAELTADIADRDKLSVNEMEAKSRKILGIQSPVEMLHTVTPRMRTALKIRTLEEQSEVQWLKGNDAESQRLQSEADQIRKSNPWLKRADVDPMAKTNLQLEEIKLQMQPMMDAAKLITTDAK